MIHVAVLSASDGMEELAAVSRRLAKDAAVAPTRNSTPADQALIEANLSGTPHDIVLTGAVCSVSSCPPRQRASLSFDGARV